MDLVAVPKEFDKLAKDKEALKEKFYAEHTPALYGSSLATIGGGIAGYKLSKGNPFAGLAGALLARAGSHAAQMGFNKNYKKDYVNYRTA